MPGAVWFPDGTLNYAEHALFPPPGPGEDDVAVIFVREDGERPWLTWRKLRTRVAAVPAALVGFGVGRGAGRCEWCQRHAAVEAHQVRKLADLARPGRPQPAWAKLMAKMRRKTLIVCIPCHQANHAGTRTAATT